MDLILAEGTPVGKEQGFDNLVRDGFRIGNVAQGLPATDEMTLNRFCESIADFPKLLNVFLRHEIPVHLVIHRRRQEDGAIRRQDNGACQVVRKPRGQACNKIG